MNYTFLNLKINSDIDKAIDDIKFIIPKITWGVLLLDQKRTPIDKFIIIFPISFVKKEKSSDMNLHINLEEIECINNIKRVNII